MLTPAIDTALQGFVLHQLLMVLCALWAGLFMGMALTLVGLVGVSRVMAWWQADGPDVRSAKAIVACWKVPLDRRRQFVTVLRQAWGEGPFRTVA